MLANASSTPESGAPRHRLSSTERRAAIVQTAFELFSERGFRGTTTRELAAAVGVSEPVLYQHFATKRDLYNALVDVMIERATTLDRVRMEQLSQGSDDRAFFQMLGEVIMDWNYEHPSAVRLMLFSALEGHELADLWHERATKEFRGFVEHYMERRTLEGGLKVKDADMTARAFISMVGHYGMMAKLFPGHKREDKPSEVVAQFVDIFLNGIRR